MEAVVFRGVFVLEEILSPLLGLVFLLLPGFSLVAVAFGIRELTKTV